MGEACGVAMGVYLSMLQGHFHDVRKNENKFKRIEMITYFLCWSKMWLIPVKA